ncbi:MAG: molybdate ABC transporter substrate-binding protein [Actinomycetota bacterium]|jgi:molybdate transport system substrate-binding protein|tara:strand:+ start:3069 stop:3845 length:777 start_codon:yes stop_codon:yes gene_type:complete
MKAGRRKWQGVCFTLSLSILLITLLNPQSASVANPKNINVFAASSLQGEYSALTKKFVAAHPGVKINISYGSSATLASQINSGAPFDIFVSADESSMASAGSEIASPSDYVVNQVILAVPLNSQIKKMVDLNSKVKWIRCSRTVPCGIAADRAISAKNVIKSAPVSYESSASSTLAKLLAGAVDAAILYKTDVIANPTKIRAITFADSKAASTQYKIGISKTAIASNNRWAKRVFQYLQSTEIRIALAKAGFQVDSLK